MNPTARKEFTARLLDEGVRFFIESIHRRCVDMQIARGSAIDYEEVFTTEFTESTETPRRLIGRSWIQSDTMSSERSGRFRVRGEG